MTLDEADAIIAELNICFSSKKLVVEEVKRWEENLLTFDYYDGKKAVKIIENSSRFWPSWAEFKDAIWPLHTDRLNHERWKRDDANRMLDVPQTEEDKQKIAKIIKDIKAGLFKPN